jgi:hypothetical protein
MDNFGIFLYLCKNTNMLTFETHPQDIQEMKNIINRNIFHSILFIKADGSLRPVNGRKRKYVSSSPDTENRGKFDRQERNILTVFDRNKQQTDSTRQPMFDENGKPMMGAPISVRLDRLLFFKAGNFVRDFTQENADAIQAAGISPERIEAEKRKLKIENDSGDNEPTIQEMVYEEMTGLKEGFDYQKLLGKSIATTQEMIDKANADDVYGIEPNSTWETMYRFEKIMLMNTRLRIQYQGNNGSGWKPVVDDVNLTQDRINNFDEAKYMLAWVRRAIKKGYTRERNNAKAEDKLNSL